MTPARRPLLSIITPVYQPAPDILRSTIDSVRSQTFQEWELILVDDCSPGPAISAELERADRLDPRITVISRRENGGISAASQDGLDRAGGAFIALLDHDDLLARSALQRIADVIAADAEVDYIYTDEDKIDARGRHYDPFHKPDWSPERLRSQMYTAHLSVLRTDLARTVGGFRPGFDGSQDHDLVLRVTERARRIVHVAQVLYHWRVVPGSTAGDPNAKPYAWLAGRRAVADQVERLGIDATVELGPLPGTYRLERRLGAEVSVSIVIPTRGGSALVWGQSRCFVVEAVRSVLAHTEHPNLEVVIVYDTPTPADVLDELREILGHRLLLVEYDQPFNFSQKCNLGVLAARGDVVVMLNDDVQVRSEHWLENLVAPLQDNAVGLTGAKLFYADGTIQHGGHLYDRGEFGHAFLGADPDSMAAFAALHIDREASGVTAACAALRRQTYLDVGGFFEGLPANFNDVDFCFKIRGLGYRIVWLAHVELFHFESRTRLPVVHAWEVEAIHNRWGTFAVDPYLPLTPRPFSARARSGARRVFNRIRALGPVPPPAQKA